MATSLVDEDWNLLAGLLPPQWRELARTEGAIRRARGISDPEVLLQLILMHAATGLSLVQTVARAQAQGLASLSDVGLLKRLRTSEKWLRELAKRMFEAKPLCSPAGKRFARSSHSRGGCYDRARAGCNRDPLARPLQHRAARDGL